MSVLRSFIIFTGCTFALALAGCDATPTTTTAADTGAAADPAVSPLTERDLRRQREFEEAVRGLAIVDGVLEVRPLGLPNPARAAEYRAEGEERLARNLRTEAIQSFARAVRTDPARLPLYLDLGGAFTTKGKTDWAAATYRAALERDPSFVEARSELAVTLWRDQQMDEAIAEMSRVLELDPDDTFAHERLAIWNYYTGRYPSAWAHVGRAEKLGHQMPGQFIALLEQQMPRP